jgi:Na+-transporting methylmalonyl-CoA/oxaloacetate decarboxylase gamma subunit
MNLSLILTLLKLALWAVQALERAKLKAEGKAEAYAETKEIHDQRVAEALAARADADDIAGVHDPFNRDNAGRH